LLRCFGCRPISTAGTRPMHREKLITSQWCDSYSRYQLKLEGRMKKRKPISARSQVDCFCLLPSYLCLSSCNSFGRHFFRNVAQPLSARTWDRGGRRRNPAFDQFELLPWPNMRHPSSKRNDAGETAFASERLLSGQLTRRAWEANPAGSAIAGGVKVARRC